MAHCRRIPVGQGNFRPGAVWLGRCTQLCETNPIFTVFGLIIKVRGKNEPNRSQFAVCGTARGVRPTAVYTLAPNKPNFAVFGLEIGVGRKSKANQRQFRLAGLLWRAGVGYGRAF